MTAQRQITIMHASAIVRGIAMDLGVPVLQAELIELANLILQSAVMESIEGIVTAKRDLRKLRDRLLKQNELRARIVGEALDGTLLLLLP